MYPLCRMFFAHSESERERDDLGTNLNYFQLDFSILCKPASFGGFKKVLPPLFDKIPSISWWDLFPKPNAIPRIFLCPIKTFFSLLLFYLSETLIGKGKKTYFFDNDVCFCPKTLVILVETNKGNTWGERKGYYKLIPVLVWL